MSDVLRQISYLIFPRRCLFCGAVVAPHICSCEKCLLSAERVAPPVCLGCGRSKDRCACGRRKRFFTAAAVPFYYTGSVRECIIRFKFGGKSEMAKGLGGEMAKAASGAFDNLKLDIAACVPMCKAKEKARGFNQSALLCRETAKQLKIDCDCGLLKKIYETPNQHDLPSNLRSGNIFGVFEVAKPEKVAGKTVLLCDDISTSGETLNECAKMLILSGAEKVACVCAAAVPGRDKKRS